MIAGHWHDGKQYDDLYYVGSPTRYKFNEDEKKGIGIWRKRKTFLTD